MHTLSITTQQREEILDITPLLQAQLQKTGLTDGTITVFSPHTTAGISVNENADPDVKHDILAYLRRMIPQAAPCFRHQEGNSDAHIKAGLIGFSQTFIVQDRRIQLGTWQGIFFMEFDGPRPREVWWTITPA